jgi:hypothetical protein
LDGKKDSVFAQQPGADFFHCFFHNKLSFSNKMR